MYRVDSRKHMEVQAFEHYMILRFTSFRQPIGEIKPWSINEIYSNLQKDEKRNNLIVEDILKNIAECRNIIVISERREHVELLIKILKDKKVKNVFSLTGGNSKSDNKKSFENISKISNKESVIIVATGKFIGEGFDLPCLDTLFLAMPISWKGTLQQYVGRLNRNYEGKTEVKVYDYVDIQVPILERMYQKRLKGYASIGYKIKNNNDEIQKCNSIFNSKNFQDVYKNDILQCKKSVFIISPFLSIKRIQSSLNELTRKKIDGIEVTVVTKSREDFRGNDKSIFVECIEVLRENGIKVEEKPKIHQKFAVIDEKIVWYGSINLLSFGRSEESIMRLESEAIAFELLSTIKY